MRALLFLMVRLCVAMGAAVLIAIGIGNTRTSALAQFINRSGCLQTCWNGIEPGHTTVGQALSVLRSLPYVQQSRIYTLNTIVQWQWTPGFSWARTDHDEMTNYLVIEGGVVQTVGLMVAFRVGELMTILGLPTEFKLSLDYAARNICPYGVTLAYGEITMRYMLVADCMGDVPDFSLYTANGRYVLHASADESGVILRRMQWSGFKSMSRYLESH